MISYTYNIQSLVEGKKHYPSAKLYTYISSSNSI